jgi:MinD-like ATPase involved in chromosome partitioning or flagellar assembly
MSDHPRPEHGAPDAARRPRRLTIVRSPPDQREPRVSPPVPKPRAQDSPPPAAVASTVAATADRGAQPGRGALLAVCGLCGGAGASTLSLLIARFALWERGGAVLVCDTGGPGGGLAAYAHSETPRSLPEIAERLEAGLPAGEHYTVPEEGLRVLATTPRLPDEDECPVEGIATFLQAARAAHRITVVDCGTLARRADQITVRAATHVAWVLPATASAVERAGRVLEAVNPYMLGRQMVIARRDHADAKASSRELETLARRCNGPLILIPALPDLLDGKPAVALEAAQVGLQAIIGVLSR